MPTATDTNCPNLVSDLYEVIIILNSSTTYNNNIIIETMIPYSSAIMEKIKSEVLCGKTYFIELFPAPTPNIFPFAIAALALFI